MSFSYKITDVFACSLERAFKAPILGDATKFMKGYLFQPPVTGFEGDKTWGEINGIRYPINNGSFLVKKGRMFKDVILERIENKYWKIEVSNFNYLMLGFSKFVGEWKTTELERDKILIEYTYTLHSEIVLLYPLHWLFAKIFFKKYMKKVLENIREMIRNNEPYLYN